MKAADDESQAPMKVAAHHHVWRIGRGDYGWLTPDMPLYRDYTLADLRPLLGDITATVLVQAAPTEAETGYLLNVARNADGLVRGVVGWEDLTAHDAPARIADLAADGLLKGLRPMLQDIADTAWILQPAVQPALHAIEAGGLCFDALVQPRHLPALLGVCGRHPGLKLVIDHAAKPAIAADTFRPWADDIARLARETRALCKLSGLVTEAAPDWHADDLRRYVDHLLACFGPSRLMWGSDWPVVERAGGYARWRDATSQLLSGLDDHARAAILGGTATGFYQLA
jgi:L-fuconolactonase